MPRLSEATKDAISCDKLAGRSKYPVDPQDLRMGQPVDAEELIKSERKQTQGTETSKYPEEKKTNVIP
jgi:hypothetical protein